MWKFTNIRKTIRKDNCSIGSKRGNIPLVCIDETEGRRFARIEKLTLTGSIGILLKARKNKIIPYSMKEIIPKIVEHGIWLSERVIKEVLAEDALI